MINIKSHVSNKNIQKQFNELDSLNLKERFYYGIISESVPDKKDSPLAVTVAKNTFYIYAGVSTGKDSSQDYLSILYEKEDGSLAKEVIPQGVTTWQYGDIPYETAVSISNCLASKYGNYLYSYVENDSVVAITMSGNTYITIFSPSRRLNIRSSSSLQINKGTVVFPDGNKLSLDKEVPFDFTIEDAVEGDEFRILLKYKFVPASYGENLFGESEIKSYTFDALENCIVFEKVDEGQLEDDEVCLGIVKIINGAVTIVDSNGHLYTYNRPWFSAKDVEHRNELGSSKVTKNNPHGIGYNDIDPDNTLHNRLLDNGIVISKPAHIQDCSGVYIEEKLSVGNILIDENNTFKLPSSDPDKSYYPMYHKLSYYPNQILGIYNENDEEVSYKHIKGTCYLLVEDKLENITVKYLTTKTASSNIDYSQGIVINSLDKNDLLLSEGKNVTQFDTLLNLFHKNINGYYVVGIDKNGNLISNPEIKINNNLEIDSDNINDVSSISRAKIYLYNTDSKFDLRCPTSGIDFEATEEFNLSKTNASFLINSNNESELFRESYISPSYNNYKEISEDSQTTIPRTDKLVKDYIKIILSTPDGNNVNVKKLNIEDYGVVNSSRRTITLNIDSESKKLLGLKGLIKIKNYTEATAPFVNINYDSTLLKTFEGESKEITYIPIDWKYDSVLSPIDIFTNLITLTFSENLYGAYILDINLNLIYDECVNRYFLTQEEDDGNQVSRVLYDPYTEYGDSVIKIGDEIYIKKEDVVYNEDDLFKATSSNSNVVVSLDDYEGKEVTFNFVATKSYTPATEETEEITKVILNDSAKNISVEILSEGTEYSISDNYEGILLSIPSFSAINTGDTVNIVVKRKIDSEKFPIINNLKTNSDFKVEVSIYGESNGESITETLVFDSDFREQDPFNYKLTENAFESISKYTIDSRNTNGNILILTFPISNYANPCNISFMQFTQDNTITKYIDSRICVPKIDDSIIDRNDIYDMLNTSPIIDLI